MKTRFYGVMSEFYEDGTVKAAIISRDCRVTPKGDEREVYGMTARIVWFTTEAEAEAFLAKARNITEAA
jgi:hypothetical protein